MVHARWLGGSRTGLLILMAISSVAASVLAASWPAAAGRDAYGDGARNTPLFRPVTPSPRRPLASGRRPPLDLRRELPARVRVAGLFSVPLQSFNLTTFPRPPAAGR